MTTTYYTADLHFGHARISELCGRPFDSVEQMNRVLTERWNSVVRPEDTVYVLGDLAMGKIADSLEWCAKLTGIKLLVPGNHDRCWSGNKKVRERDRTMYEDAGFAVLAEELVTPQGWRLCHFPYAGDSHDADRFLDHRPADDGGWLLHGHVHEAWRVKGRMINVGCDVWGWAPVSAYVIQGLTQRPDTPVAHEDEVVA